MTVALGMAIGMAVITGALVTGDSVRGGLENLVRIRLGNVDLAIASGDRYLTDSIALRLSSELRIPAAAVLQMEGSATAGGGTKRVPKVQVYGVDPTFRTVLGPETFDPPVNESEAVISDNLAARLGVKEGDELLIRISKPGPVPVDAPFVSDEGNIVSVRVTVRMAAGKNLHGRFHLRNTQSAPFNVFIGRKYLQKLTGFQGSSNLILMAGNGKISAAQAEKSLASNRTIRDAGLHLDKHPVTGEWLLRTPRIFFDPPTLAAIESIPSEKSLRFSYFVNEFSTGGRSAPYSFVSTLPAGQVQPGDMLINRWLADDLAAGPGDSVSLSFFLVGPLRNLTVNQAKFRITGIIPMEDPRSDRLLMPEIPGLSDAGNCRDWETSIPVDLGKIRNQDEDYWKKFRGTPKAFINPEQAAGMWQNRFGKYTQARFPPETDPSVIVDGILSRLRPSDTGIRVREPAREGMAAASAGVDFSGLFLGLSFFLIAGGILLTILLIRLGMEGRMAQIGTLRAVGWPERRIRQMLLLENSLVAMIGTLIGLALTFLYSIAIFSALNGVWNEIVLTDTLRPVFRPATLALGMAISLLVSVASARVALSRIFKRKTTDLLGRNKKGDSPAARRLLSISSAAAGTGAVLMVVFGLIRMPSAGATLFFLAGTLMLLSLILLTVRHVRYHTPAGVENFSAGSLSRSNLYRSSSRSLSVILLFSIGIFMVVAIGSNRKTTAENKGSGLKSQEQTGTGGFLFYMETSVPVPDNLNNPPVRAKYGLETPSEFVQMKKLEGDDASCLNLNRVSNPPLLGVPAGALDGRFRFASMKNKEYRSDPWKMLEEKLPAGVIPAVADQTVIQWGLGLNIGDTLKYKSGQGDTVNIVLTGGLVNSIFQGNLLISESQLIRYWPAVSGTNIFLLSADPTGSAPVLAEMHRVFRDYGADLKEAAVKLAEFSSVENTYLSIFLVMGALAMLLGTIGLAVILARNLQERRAEIAILRATGFSMRRILWLVVREYAALLLFGTLAGGISACVAVLPGVLNPAGEVSLIFLIAVLFALISNGLFWIVLLAWNSVRNMAIVNNLRSE